MDSWISRNVLQGLQDLNYISYTIQFFIWSNQYVIFASQVSDLLIFSPTPRGFSQCICDVPQDSKASKHIWLKCLNCDLNGPQQILAWITSPYSIIQGILSTTFSTELPLVKGVW